MEGFINDELQIYRGQDFFIKEGIIIHQPTLDEICDYGERDYYSMIYSLTSVGADMKWQLNEIGIDYSKIGDFELFSTMICKNYSKEKTSIIFNDLDLSKFKLYLKNDNGATILSQQIEKVTEEKNSIDNKFMKIIKKKIRMKQKYKRNRNVEFKDLVIDECTYLVIVDVLRKMHGLKRNNQLPGNESTKQFLIEDAKEEYLLNRDKEYHSQLLNLVSTMINSEGFKYNHSEVWDMKINAFMDSVKRISKIKNAELLLQSGYSGYGIDLKNINNKQIDWLGELD